MRRRTIERKHTIKSKTITVLLVACLIALIPATVTAEEQAIVPDDVRAQQIKDMKFGMFVCWSFSTFSGYEWTRGVEDVGFFRATGCDTDQWCKTAKDRVEPFFFADCGGHGLGNAVAEHFGDRGCENDRERSVCDGGEANPEPRASYRAAEYFRLGCSGGSRGLLRLLALSGT